MKKLTLSLSAAIIAAMAIAHLPDAVLTPSTKPQVKQPVVELKNGSRRAIPMHVRRQAGAELQAAFSVQGANSQEATWSENFDQGSTGWTLGKDPDNYFGWELKTSSGNYAFTPIDPNDVQSLFIEGPYQTWRRAIATASSPAIDVPANGILHAYVGYSQNMNSYAVLTINVTTDDFTTVQEVWNSTQEDGATSWRWHELELPMTQWEGQQVKLQFVYGPGTNDSFGTGGYMADYYIDGLSMTGVAEVNGVNVQTGEVVNFVDMSQGDVTGWQWSFPGGTPETSTEATPAVYYKHDGTYDVTLTVTDAAGTTSTVTREGFVTVTGNAPVAKILPPATFRYDDTHLPMVCPLMPVQYRDASTGFPTEWNWTFTGTTPASSSEEMPWVSYDYQHEQSVTLDVANQHGTSHDAIQVSAEYQGYISNILPSDYPVVCDLDGEGSFPGSNKMKINAYAEKFSKPSCPMVVYGAVVFFESATAEALTDQLASVGVHLCEVAEDGTPGQKKDSFWWSVYELETGNSTTLRGTLFEFSPQVIKDEFYIMVDGIPTWNDSCDVSFAMASQRDHDNTAYMLLRDQWRPVTGFFKQGYGTSFYIMPLIAHSPLTLLPVGTTDIEVPPTAGTIEQQIFSMYGYDNPEPNGNDWCRITSTPNDLTLDTLTIAYDALPAGIDSRTTTFTITDRMNASTCTFNVIQKAAQQQYDKGDVNGDGNVDISDVSILIDIILGLDHADNYDVRAYINDDDLVDITDVSMLIDIILGL